MKIKQVATALVACVLAGGLNGTGPKSELREDPMSDRLWFQKKDFTQLVLTKRKAISDDRVVATVRFPDGDGVRRVMGLIEAIPANGDEMKSWGESASLIALEFTGGDAVKRDDIIEGKFKTPSTGFNSMRGPEESLLAAGIDGLLDPRPGAPVFKCVGLPVKYKEFEIVPRGTTRTSDRESYELRTRGRPALILEVFSSQTPPAPVEFKIGKTSYLLRSYETEDGRRLYPDFFQITAALTPN